MTTEIQYTKGPSHDIQGLEILLFDNVMLQQNISGAQIFSSVGRLRVFYFEEINNFVLCLNEWKFPLLKDLTIMKILENTTMPLVYTIPNDNGAFVLSFLEVQEPGKLRNFELILSQDASFAQRLDMENDQNQHDYDFLKNPPINNRKHFSFPQREVIQIVFSIS